MSQILSMYREKNKAIILVYGPIGFDEESKTDTSEKKIATQLQEMGDISEIEIRINSPGGIVYSGVAIYNVLKNHKAKKIVYIDGIAASIASVIAMAGDEIVMCKGSTFMIHNPSTFAGGESKDLKKTANTLGKIEENMLDIYAAKNKVIDREKIRALMSEETFMTAEETVTLGFATSIQDVEPNINGFNSKAIVALNEQYNKNKEGGIMSKYKGLAEAIVKAIQENEGSIDANLNGGAKENIIAAIQGKTKQQKESHEIAEEQELNGIVAEITEAVLTAVLAKSEKPKAEETLVNKVLGNLGFTAKKEESKEVINKEVIAQAVAIAVIQAMAEKKEEVKSNFFANFSTVSKREDATELGKIENTHAKDINSDEVTAGIINDVIAIANGQ